MKSILNESNYTALPKLRYREKTRLKKLLEITARSQLFEMQTVLFDTSQILTSYGIHIGSVVPTFIIHNCNTLLRTCNNGIHSHTAEMQENERNAYRNTIKQI